MRLKVDVVTRATEIPWGQVLAPGRGVAYRMLSLSYPALGQHLHEYGWGTRGMVPFGHSAPAFPSAARVPGRYSAGGRGSIEFGSPLLPVVEAWAWALRDQELIDWGGVVMYIVDIQVMEPPDFSSGRARLRTGTPVVLKAINAGRDGHPVWVLPNEPDFPACFQHNLDRKLETLGLPGKVRLEGITWVGAKRSMSVGEGRGKKPGAPIEVKLSGDPEALQAIWSWGLGQSNSAGFGWIRA